MKFQIPTTAQLQTAGINLGGLVIGFTAGNAIKTFLMTKRVAADGTENAPIIKDTTITNAIAAVATAGLGLTLGGSTPIVQMIFLAASAYFAIRTVNLVTDGLKGVDGLNGLKETLNKFIPNLRGMDDAIEGAYTSNDYGFAGYGMGSIDAIPMLQPAFTSERSVGPQNNTDPVVIRGGRSAYSA